MENLLRPWVIALLLATGAAAFAWARGLAIAVSVLRRFRPERRDAAQIELERSAELGARFIQLGAFSAAAAFGLLVLGADHAAEEIRGAMCAHGVLASTRTGFLAAGLGLAVFVVGVVWSQLHRLDLELREPRLTKPKFVFFSLLSPLALASAVANVTFVTELDFGVVATCCSASTDAASALAPTASSGMRVVFPLHLAALGIAGLAALYSGWRPSRWTASVAGATTVAGVLSAVPAVNHYVAPHVYETPSHRCPFCLLHLPDALFGIPLYAAMGLALFGGTALLVRSLDPRLAEGARTTPARRTALLTAAYLVALAAAMIAPVARYHVATGGASLFGAAP